MQSCALVHQSKQKDSMQVWITASIQTLHLLQLFGIRYNSSYLLLWQQHTSIWSQQVYLLLRKFRYGRNVEAIKHLPVSYLTYQSISGHSKISLMNRVSVVETHLNSSLLLKIAGQVSSASACDSVSSSKSVRSSWTGTPHSSSWNAT